MKPQHIVLSLDDTNKILTLLARFLSGDTLSNPQNRLFVAELAKRVIDAKEETLRQTYPIDPKETIQEEILQDYNTLNKAYHQKLKVLSCQGGDFAQKGAQKK